MASELRKSKTTLFFRRWDTESSIYHYRARQYDPSIGRFLQRDPLDYIDGMNLYTYVHNNPTNFTDPTGEAWWIPIIEGALFAYDTYGLISTFSDPCASGAEKAAVGAAWTAGALSFGDGTTLAARRAAQEAAERASSQFSKKITKQISERGWTKESIHSTILNPTQRKTAINKATGNKATAFFSKDGSYVVKDDVTGDIIQISDKTDPFWVPDSSIGR
ncbi:MAG: colicin E5-related ribonuclease [Candidatus Omnitrophota bacterium]